MKDGLIFANARAKAKESNLLSEERVRRMTEAKTVSDAMRILLEVNYAGGLIPEGEDFYSLLTEEERIVNDFVRSAAPQGVGFECFFLRNDYHNIKVLFKAKYANIKDITEMILPDGNYSFSELKERFDKGKLDFDPYIAEACEKIDRLFETDNGSARKIDVILDRALYDDINSRLKNADKYIKEYFSAFADLTNVSSFVRTVKIGGNFAFFEEGFLNGGSIGIKQFEECAGDCGKAIALLQTALPKTERVDEKDLAAYETAQDNYLLKIFSQNRSDMFSVAPILGYYLAKLTEIKVIRVIMVCIKNGVSPEETRKRVRDIYA